MVASWISRAVQPPTWVPACKRTSRRRMIRVSWILMPGWRTEPTVMGRAIRCSSGKSVWTFEPLGLESGEPPDDGLELVADLIQMIQSLLETEVVEVVGTEFVAQEHRELLILPENSIAEVGAEHMMAVLDLIDDGRELTAVVARQAGAEDLGDLVGGQSPQAKLTASLEQLVDGKVALEHKIEAVLDLTDRIGAR